MIEGGDCSYSRCCKDAGFTCTHSGLPGSDRYYCQLSSDNEAYDNGALEQELEEAEHYVPIPISILIAPGVEEIVVRVNAVVMGVFVRGAVFMVRIGFIVAMV